MPVAEQFLSVITHADIVGYPSLLIDYVGSGCSDSSKGFDYSIANHACSVAAVLDNEGVKGCTIIGHSMGGTVGILLAILRPDLVSKLIVAEANISPGGGEATRRIASYSQAEYVNEAHHLFLKKLSRAEREGDTTAAFINSAWRRTDPADLYQSSVALVDLNPAFTQQFLKLSIPRTFIYGERSLSKDQDKAQPDAPDPDELKRFGVQIAIVPHAGHAMMFDNLPGYVSVLKDAIRS